MVVNFNNAVKHQHVSGWQLSRICSEDTDGAAELQSVSSIGIFLVFQIIHMKACFLSG